MPPLFTITEVSLTSFDLGIKVIPVARLPQRIGEYDTNDSFGSVTAP